MDLSERTTPLSSFQASVDESLAKFHVARKNLDYLSSLATDADRDYSESNKENQVAALATNVNVNCRPMPFRSRVLPSVKFVLNTYSRKVFIGGLPPDISADEITTQFSSFGTHKVDWPHRSSTDLFPPKGFAFLLYTREESVHHLMSACTVEDSKFYFFLSSISTKNKKVQVRPWCLQHNDAFLNDNKDQPLNPRTTLFVGGVPRLVKAQELGEIMNNAFGHVSYAGIDVDPWMKYPKGSARVSFMNKTGYIEALKTRFVHLKTAEVNKQVEVKPFVLCDQECDECERSHSASHAAFYCPNLACLKYYCERCWKSFHRVHHHQPIIINTSCAFTPRPIPPPANNPWIYMHVRAQT